MSDSETNTAGTGVRLSIITATFNASATLQHCIDSVAAQTCSVEHVVVDGGSNDSTMQIVEANGEHIARSVSESDDGLYDAMNKGVDLCRGDVIGILNADDFYADDWVLEKVSQVFQDPSVDACYGDLLYVAEDDIERVTRTWRSGHYSHKRFLWGWMPPHPTFFVRRKLYDDFGRFNLSLGSAADYELMLRFLYKHRASAHYLPHVLVKMRAGGVSNASWSNRLAANRMDRRAWQVNELSPLPWTTLVKPARKVLQWL
ncbi:MAG: glycosyltransferase family 2 protein [Gammaproteobacteria bacterium]